MHKLTTQQFIEKAIKVHGDKYDYSKAEYINNYTKVVIICQDHGEFSQTPKNHLKGQGCKKCVSKNKTTQDIIAEFTDIHGDKYNYDRINYINNRSKVVIICQDHGEFKQRPNDHLQRKGCPKCVGKNKTTQDLIAEFTEIHGDKYDYSSVEYKKTNIPVKIICSKHGEFKQIPNNHLKGQGCYDCGKYSQVKKRTKIQEQFIIQAKEKHNDKYDYSLVEYINNNTSVKIICPKHGEFKQIPTNHLQGKGCAKCVNKNETKTGEILTELLPNIRLARQLSWGKIFKITSHNKRKADFSFEKDGQKYIVEYNGGQHYFPVKFGKMTSTQAEKQFSKQQQRDQELRDLCKEHNINLIEIDGREYTGSKIKDYLIQCFSS